MRGEVRWGEGGKGRTKMTADDFGILSTKSKEKASFKSLLRY